MNGVVHVGGHSGEEVDGYLKEGRSPIIVFEPQNLPHVVNPNVTWVPFALSDEECIAPLYIPHHITAAEGMDTQCASLLPVNERTAVASGWTITAKSRVDVPVTRFDMWAYATGFQRGSCSLLCIDVNGLEARVLRGFGTFLKDFQEIIVECSCPPLYWGSTCAHMVAMELAENGFHTEQEIPKHGDVRFIR